MAAAAGNSALAKFNALMMVFLRDEKMGST
jgi:hypothetical protein